MLYFYETPIIINTEILNDNYKVKFYDSYIMPNNEVQDHYFQNQMEQLNNKISCKEFVQGGFTLALSIPDLYVFVKEWYARVPRFNTILGIFDISQWFEDYLISAKKFLENARKEGNFFNYYDLMTLDYIQAMLCNKNYTKGGVSRVDWSKFNGREIEYTWMLDDTFASCEMGVQPKYIDKLKPYLQDNKQAAELLLSNLETLTGRVIDFNRIYAYVNILGLQDGRVPNYVYIQKCLNIMERGCVTHAQ